MSNIEIKIEKRFEVLSPKMRKVIEKATVNSLNHTANQMRKMLQQEITNILGIKRKDLIKRLYVFRADRDKLRSGIELNGGGISLFKFDAKKIKVQSNKGKRIGATAMIKGVRTLIPGGFLAEMKSGKTGVFQRAGEKRLPIKEMFSNEVTDLFKSNPGFLSRVKEDGNKKLQLNIEQDYAFYYSKEFGTR
jgi:hypothetical protein